MGTCILDIVAYEKSSRVVRIIECKLGSHVTTIGHAFGQIHAYTAVPLGVLQRGRSCDNRTGIRACRQAPYSSAFHCLILFSSL